MSDGDGDHSDDQLTNGADYKVAFCRPPLYTPFKPGQSGKPSGRVNGSKNLKSLFHRFLNEQIALQGWHAVQEGHQGGSAHLQARHRRVEGRSPQRRVTVANAQTGGGYVVRLSKPPTLSERLQLLAARLERRPIVMMPQKCATVDEWIARYGELKDR